MLKICTPNVAKAEFIAENPSVFRKTFRPALPLDEVEKTGCDSHRSGNRFGQFFFVQIGANDGVIYDPIHKYVREYDWRGLLVEPVGAYFRKLKNNYRQNHNLIFENAAISDQDETRDFYRIRDDIDFLPEWCQGLGTFHLDVLLTHKWAIPNISDYVVNEKIRCLSLRSLLHKHGIQKIDLLLIDTEGHDYAILEQLDFASLRPRIIVFEHQYLTKPQIAECNSMLRNNGYGISRFMGNTAAYTDNS